MNGYSGKILTIDLEKNSFNTQTFDENFARKYLGGNGFAAKILYDGLKPGINPLSPENMVVFAVGPVTDTGSWTSGACCRGNSTHRRFLIPLLRKASRSPKAHRFEAIVLQGKSVPVYLT
jgi:aldehyde:ferredoxin oxidoreductase